MKKALCLVFGTLLLTSSCKTVLLHSENTRTPPGQVKKVTGAKSAKAYAPGQQKQKKHNN